MRTVRPREDASVTLVALCFTTVLAIALSSYLALCLRSYDLSTRQLYNDKARELAHAGLEEALWALNQGNWTNSGPGGSTSWTTSGADRSVTLAYTGLGQGASGQVVLTVTNYASTGPAWPAISAVATITLGDGRTMSKTLQAATKPAPLFGNAIASANSYVSFVSRGTVDSWNSDPGNTGSYTAPYSFTSGAAANYAAVVAATDNNDDYDGTHAVILNQAQVDGYIATAGKTVSYSTSGSPHGKVQGPVTPAGVDVDDMRLGKSAFIPSSPVFTVTPPALVPGNYTLLSFLLALLTITPADSPIYSAPSGFTMPTGLLGLGTTLDINRPVQMVVNGDFTIGSGLFGPAHIVISSTGSLEVFVNGDVSIGGNGIDNQTHDPRKLAIFCTNASATNSVQYTTSAAFYGVIYSVNKPIDIRQDATFYGALLSGSYVRFSTSATAPVFHYDTALRTVRFSNVATPYVISQLTEP